jgi:hypothetical protein
MFEGALVEGPVLFDCGGGVALFDGGLEVDVGLDDGLVAEAGLVVEGG